MGSQSIVPAEPLVRSAPFVHHPLPRSIPFSGTAIDVQGEGPKPAHSACTVADDSLAKKGEMRGELLPDRLGENS